MHLTLIALLSAAVWLHLPYLHASYTVYDTWFSLTIIRCLMNPRRKRKKCQRRKAGEGNERGKRRMKMLQKEKRGGKIKRNWRRKWLRGKNISGMHLHLKSIQATHATHTQTHSLFFFSFFAIYDKVLGALGFSSFSTNIIWFRGLPAYSPLPAPFILWY